MYIKIVYKLILQKMLLKSKSIEKVGKCQQMFKNMYVTDRKS